MIYVTHDQTEALTFADQVVVMHEGQIVQTGTPVELFEKPKHTFVGHFIGSPGMNILSCKIKNGEVNFSGQKIPIYKSIKKSDFTINTIEFAEDNFFKKLRDRLFWGQDMRNTDSINK